MKDRVKLERLAEDGLPSISGLDTEAVVIRRKPTWAPLLVGALLIAGIVFWVLTNKPHEKTRKAPVVPVTIGTVETRDMPLSIYTIGNVMPISSINVKSRIEGHIMKMHFKEGDFVEKGQLLFTIDPRPLQAAANEANANVLKQRAMVKQAEATLSKDRAALAQSTANKLKDVAQQTLQTREYKRYAMLAEQGAVSVEQADQVKTNLDAAKATIQADEAQIENSRAAIESDQANLENARAQLSAAEASLDNARVQLGFTSITAPISGRTGSLQAYEGNLVKPDDVTLVVINQMAPIYVTFAVPEQALTQIRAHQGAAESLVVSAAPPGDSNRPALGRLTFSENAIDMTTGTIKLKATFDNADSKLWPGEFVNVSLLLETQPHVTVVAAQAVQEGQNGPFVFVVKPDMTVSVQPVVVDRTADNFAVIKSGLAPGDKVVTDGQLQLVGGSKIQPKSADVLPK